MDECAAADRRVCVVCWRVAWRVVCRGSDGLLLAACGANLRLRVAIPPMVDTGVARRALGFGAAGG